MAGGIYPYGHEGIVTPRDLAGAYAYLYHSGKARGDPDWTADDSMMSHAVDCLTVVLERNGADERRTRLLHAARELVLMAAMPDPRQRSDAVDGSVRRVGR